MRTHEDRCSTHEAPHLGIGVTISCDGTCLNEVCDACLAETGQQCAPFCVLANDTFEGECPSCGAVIGSARTCPLCGHKVTDTGTLEVTLAVIVALLWVAFLLYLMFANVEGAWW